MDKIENLGIHAVAAAIERLNPTIIVHIPSANAWPYTIVIKNTDDKQSLQLPEGYYYNDKNGITNKHNTASGIYEAFMLLDEVEYLNLVMSYWR